MLEIKGQLESKIANILGIDPKRVAVENTNDLTKGDLTTNIAMQLSKELHKSPREIAENIVSELKGIDGIEKIEVAGPGFINFYLSDQYLKNTIKTILEKGSEAFNFDIKQGKNLIIEYTDPNPFKILHIGHLYTNMVGESFARLQEALGANVVRANYQGDVGLHVAKTLWGLEKKLADDGMEFKDLYELSLVDRVKYLGDAYILGFHYYDDEKQSDVIEEVKKINYYIFSLFSSSLDSKDFFDDMVKRKIEHMYREGRIWCLQYFERIYERTGTKFDHYFFESEVGESGLKLVLENTDEKGKGVFKTDSGSIIYEGNEDKGLHTRVFVNKEGLPTYEAKELGLAFAKKEKVDYEESVVITADEQSAYFRVVFDALSQLDVNLANASRHMSHGMVKLPGAEKMSSRKGKIIEGEWLLDETKARVKELMQSNEKWVDLDIEGISDIIAVAAIKYAFLKVSVGKDVIFDMEKSISFDGDTGPYLLYVYARCRSLLENAQDSLESVAGEFDPSERDLVRILGRFEGALLGSATQYSPSILCSYLFDLGQSFNKFYQSVRILDSNRKDQLLDLVEATATVMKYGLDRLGIKTVDHM